MLYLSIIRCSLILCARPAIEIAEKELRQIPATVLARQTSFCYLLKLINKTVKSKEEDPKKLSSHWFSVRNGPARQ